MAPPKGSSEALRRAVQWLNERGEPVTPALIEAASRRFDLSPLDEQFLLTHFLTPDGAGAQNPGDDESSSR